MLSNRHFVRSRSDASCAPASRRAIANMANHEPTQVVFACVHNAGRSQMAAALFNQMADSSRARAVSAGTRPSAEVHPVVVEAMREVGLNLGGVKPRLLTPELAAGSRVLVTMGCGEECPYIAGAERADWPLEDPADLPLEGVRAIRDEIRRRVIDLLARHGWARAAQP